MEATRIPLDAIEAAFFNSGDEDSTPRNLDEADEYEIQQEDEMNDYTVIRLGDKPKPQPAPIPKYPKFKRNVIPYCVPTLARVITVKSNEPQPEPAYEAPPRPKPRDVDPNKLSSKQLVMYGKSPFEQDVIIIERKREILSQNRKPDPDSIPAKTGVKIPSVYKTEAENIRRKKEEKQRLEEIQMWEEQKAHLRRKKQAEKDKVKADKLRRDRQERQMLERELAELERLKAEAEKREKWEKLQSNWNPNRPTRASQLKDESCRRMLQNKQVEERRDKLHAEMRRERSKKETARLKDVLERLKPSDEGKGTAERRRKELRDNQRKWVRWLRLTETENEHKQPMLERLFADDHIAEAPEPRGKRNADPNMID